jgi:hypothetical protein
MGLAGLRSLLQDHEGDFLSMIKSVGIGKDLEENLGRSFHADKPCPRAYWVDRDGIEDIILESEAFRKKVRGSSIGSLG